MENQNQDQGKKKGTIWIVLLILSAVLNIFQWKNHESSVNTFESRVDTLVVEKVNVEKELMDTKTELEKYRGISSNLDSLLNEAQAKIDIQAKKIRSLGANEKNIKSLNEKMKQQLADLQMLRDGCCVRRPARVPRRRGSGTPTGATRSAPHRARHFRRPAIPRLPPTAPAR